jgi:hypothetical protein
LIFTIKKGDKMETKGVRERDINDKIKQLEYFLEDARDEKDRRNLKIKIAALKRKLENK